MINSIILGLLAGIVGTAIGGIVSVFLGKKESMISMLLALAAGVMLSIVCFDLIPESIEYSDLVTAIISIVGGIVLVLLLDVLLERVNSKRAVQQAIAEGELSKREMSKMGFMMFLAIGLHNLPEGLVIGSSEVLEKGVLMTILIGLHNIPEGIAICAPLVAGGRSKIKSVGMTAMAGFPTVIGAIIGFLLASMVSRVFISISLGLAAGAMITVVFSDMLPEAYKIGKGKIVGLVALCSLLFGIILLRIL